MRFLFAIWEGGGNVPPELAVARRLIARGHTVTVIADPTIEAEARAAGCAFVSWTTAPHAKTRAPGGEIFADYVSKNPFAMFKTARDAFLCGPAHAYAADVLNALAEQPYDALVPCALLLGAVMAGEASRLPTISLMPNIYMFPAEGRPATGVGLLPARGPLGRLRDRILGGIMVRLFDGGLADVNRARTGLGLAPLAHVFDQFLRVDRMLMLSAECFDFPGRLPANVTYCGPMLADPTWARPWYAPWPADDPRPLVLVSFTSGYQAQEPALRRVIAALGELPVRAVVTTGQALDPDGFDAPPHVHVVRSAPHGDLLASARAIVSHCGHGTVMKALANGVPIICMPMGRDQNDNAARIVARGAGVQLAPSAPPRKITAALRQVLDDERYRTAAKQLGDAIVAETRRSDVAAEIEQIVTAASHERMAPELGS